MNQNSSKKHRLSRTPMRATILLSGGILAGMVLWASMLGEATAAAPEIAHVHPNYVGWHLRGNQVPHTIMGEGLDAEGLQIWVWSPGAKEDPLAFASQLSPEGVNPVPPAEPPEGAKELLRKRAPEVIRDRVIRELLGDAAFVWLRNSDGTSQPYPLNLAKPHWISETIARPGQVLAIFGFGLHGVWKRGHVALRSESTTLTLESGHDPAGGPPEPLFELVLPVDIKPDRYAVYVHNGTGGNFGWQFVDHLEVQSPPSESPRRVNAREVGAVGDGAVDDRDALDQAMKQLAADGGGILYLPPGTYRVTQTLDIPRGVHLLGAGAGQTRIHGDGYEPTGGQEAWWGSGRAAFSVLRLTNHSGMESLTVSGAVSIGEGQGMVSAHQPRESQGQPIERISIIDCELLGTAAHALDRTSLYRGGEALRLWGTTRHLRILNNELRGSIILTDTFRADIVGNRIRGGGIRANAYESILDRNFLSEAPGRILFYPRSRSLIRYNEMDGYFRHSYLNQPEPFLAHGGSSYTSTVGSADAGSLTDPKAEWKPGQYRDAWVLISDGRGFGQYRRVIDNSETRLELEEPWRVVPDGQSEFSVSPYMVDSIFYANRNDSVGVLSLWLNCVNMLVEKYRAHDSGANVWGRDLAEVVEDGTIKNADRFTPSWYNMFLDNWFDGGMIRFEAFEPEGERRFQGPVLFANYGVSNRLVAPHRFRIPSAADRPYTRGALSVEGPATGTVLANNFIGFANIGIDVAPEASATYIRNNTFQNVEDPILDAGRDTMIQSNKVFIKDGEGEREEDYPAPAD